MRPRRLLAVAVVAGGTFAGSAAAQTPPAPDPSVPQISQYVEVIPTAQGGVPTSRRKKGERAKDSDNLTPGARKELESRGGEDAGVLTEIASSSRPVTRTSREPREKGSEAPLRRADTPADAESLPHGVRVTATATGGARLVVMAAILVLIPAALIVASRGRLRTQALP